MSGRGRQALTVVAMLVAMVSLSGCVKGCDVVSKHEISASKDPVKVGENVTLDAHVLMRTYGDFEIDSHWLIGGSPPTGAEHKAGLSNDWHFGLSRTFARAETVRITNVLDVVQTTGVFAGHDSFGASVAQYDLIVEGNAASQPPLASFTATPNPAKPEQTIALDASASYDPDGEVVQYEWDLDGDGVYETDGGSEPTQETGWSSEGQHEVGLRVTDNDDKQGTTAGTLFVQAMPRLAPRATAGSAGLVPLSRRKAHLIQLGGYRQTDPGSYSLTGDELLLTGRKAEGKLPAGPFPKKLRRGKKKVRWAGSLDLEHSISDETYRLRGVALAAFPAGGLACMGIKVGVPASGRPSGKLHVIAGSGRAAKLRGSARGRGTLQDGVPALRGKTSFRFGKTRNRGMNRFGCKQLKRDLLG